ncbi:hypothetical protein [Roseivirga pacifica]|uniref:hypothetical protein n=1 Tax=Roseivirga pacifica TaxID=1267423 RepID=UPI00209588B9|nr:hypothetical protein [Roseivirga pacifica]MCO6357319.1 hypothetical protein [Roseivirga pacifica]MCO6367967.1 hypothetical protein [Roseivirga pacifica]MCO6369551.1 hypothetical protein [Roseivirga pacifica]MCO6373405.1 hypothetical protein [Roseivirga pacifica]MCO6377338.1 hypothetical protein [Roseivirga pacifica]
MDKAFKLSLTLILTVVTLMNANAQDLPFKSMPEYAEKYTAGTMVARMVEGLGYRYYWATEGLIAKDLAFEPTKDARDVESTIDHILTLSVMVLRPFRTPDFYPIENLSEMDFAAKRKLTLELLLEASVEMRSAPLDKLANAELDLGRGNSLPFWNVLNGPLADAIYHTGQIVSFRRMSGNPIDPSVNVLMGRNN